MVRTPQDLEVHLPRSPNLRRAWSSSRDSPSLLWPTLRPCGVPLDQLALWWVTAAPDRRLQVDSEVYLGGVDGSGAGLVSLTYRLPRLTDTYDDLQT